MILSFLEPGTQDDPIVHGKNAQCQGEELVTSGLPSGKEISSRSGILKRGFKSSQVPKGTEAAAQALEEPLAERKPFEFLDPLPGPPTHADEETHLNEEPVKDNFCRRNPKRKGRPNDKVVQEQLACGSEDDFSSDSASPITSDEDHSDTNDASPLRAKAWTLLHYI
jgi:hypothetical protein